ncbi:maltase 2 isoform X3 [Lucilia sericata]|uniref:maltase 2 isoform X3 n=1 Tax=Lucilia sericata TaxID=13632 RepID=UPI0018A80FA5|nr:maltase 2 isoform X3 [Lucilia sericata]
MKNLLKRNSRKVNVSNCGTLDCSERQTDKEVEIYKPISEDTEKLKDQNKFASINKVEKCSTSPLDNVVVLKEETPSGDNKMVQEENNVNDGADEQMLGAEDNEKLADKREEVKFIKGDQQNGDAKIDIGVVNGKDKQEAFTGMTKEELMKYANDPFWVRLRWIFFISFWLVWLGMLVGAILIIVDAPKCAAPEPLPWYKSGILAKFPTFEVNNENVAVVSQMKASGVIYELPAEDTYNIREPEVEEKIKNLVNHYKDSKVHVILDITANYVPKSSRLLKQALDDETKRSAFVWTEKVEVPNNWLSLVNGSAWAEVMPGNYVLSQFGDGLYDLHMNDSIVKHELSDVLQHAIELGVGGIRLKNTKFFILSKNFKNEIPAVTTNYDLTQYGFWTHSQTTFQEGLGDVLYEYRAVVKNSSADAFLSVADDIIRPQNYKTSAGEMGVDIPIYGQFVKNLAAPKGKKLSSELAGIMQDVNNNWVQWNVADLGDEATVSPFSIYLFLSLLPGTPVLPVGDEVYGNITNKVYDQFEQWRSSPSYMHGDFDMLSVDPLVAYTRIKSGNPGYLVVFNPTELNQPLNLGNASLPETMNVKYFSNASNATKTGQISISDFEVAPLSTAVLSYVPVKSD